MYTLREVIVGSKIYLIVDGKGHFIKDLKTKNNIQIDMKKRIIFCKGNFIAQDVPNGFDIHNKEEVTETVDNYLKVLKNRGK